ncbi:hypothetical protein BV898_05654 [Hypsibius exemplaris]|uniref:Uncharacterized protein n=1 Tax=Hypsibius exemplaris TaxID=2072580 RepID=A0A1W0WYT5_HYPEX|nr:hypothetical protein BV898_05654 [Hypsibius exemplaris]
MKTDFPLFQTLQREKSAGTASAAVKEYETDEVGKCAETAGNEVRQWVAELQTERRLRSEIEERLKTSRNDCEGLRAEVERRTVKTEALRDVIAERGQRLAEKDRTVARLTEEVQEWRVRFMAAVSGKVHTRKTAAVGGGDDDAITSDESGLECEG